MPLSEKLHVLIGALLQKTLDDKVKWNVGSRDDTFIWSGSSASVLLYTKDNDGQGPWVIRLVDEEGRTIEEEFVEFNHEAAEAMNDLYSTARSNALNIDSTINSLLKDLND